MFVSILYLRTISNALKFLYATKFDNEKAYKEIQEHFNWRANVLSKIYINPTLASALVFM
jgi:hypothetical protein